MQFRPAQLSDLRTVMTWVPDAGACLLWAGPKVEFPLQLDQLRLAIAYDDTHSYALTESADLVAFGQVRLFDSTPGILRGHLSRIIVNPVFRRKGVGEMFVRELVAAAHRLACRRVTLHVVKGNDRAIRLYEKLGFVAPVQQPENLRPGITYMELVQNV